MKEVLMMGLTPPLEGGSERHIYEISSRIEKTRVLTQKGSICRNKVEVRLFGSNTFIRNLVFLIFSFFYSIKLVFALKKKYDLVHIHENLLYFLIPLLKTRYEFVVTVHGLKGFKFYDNKRRWLFFRMMLKIADKLIAVNLEDKKILDKVNKNVKYIPNGVDLSIYSKINPKIEKKITFIGRVHEQKGIIYLLEAFERIKERLSDYRLEIIGKIDDYGLKLKEKYNDESIIWKGMIKDRKEIVRNLKSSKCIVLPSLWEGLPLTLFESLASERPVIVSDIPAFKSVISDEAIFFKSKNSEDLSKKLANVLRVEDSNIGLKGRKLAEEYDWKKIAKNTEEFYEK